MNHYYDGYNYALEPIRAILGPNLNRDECAHMIRAMQAEMLRMGADIRELSRLLAEATREASERQ